MRGPVQRFDALTFEEWFVVIEEPPPVFLRQRLKGASRFPSSVGPHHSNLTSEGERPLLRTRHFDLASRLVEGLLIRTAIIWRGELDRAKAIDFDTDKTRRSVIPFPFVTLPCSQDESSRWQQPKFEGSQPPS